MKMASAAGDTGGSIINSNGNTLLLYHYHQSYYSQKVVFALAEKKLNYRSQIIQLPKFEQYEPWYMRINARGEVPVLKDGVKLIPDSCMIIDYLEDNFSNGDTPHLQPEKGSALSQKVKYFREVIDEIPVEDITVGCMFFPDVSADMKYPKFFRARYKALREQRLRLLDDLSRKPSDLKEQYVKKLHKIKERKSKQESRDYLEQTLSEVEVLFNEVEEELASHSPKDGGYQWLCSEKFTVADISLSVLLHRIYVLGLAKRFWEQGTRPHLAAYHQRVQKLESFKLACLTTPAYAKLLYAVEMLKEKAPIIIGTAVLIAAIAFGIAYFRK